MRNLQKTVKACGVLFLVLGLSTFSWASGSDFDSKVPNFTTEIGDDVVAQTSEVTITLEKSIPKSFDDLLRRHHRKQAFYNELKNRLTSFSVI